MVSLYERKLIYEVNKYETWIFKKNYNNLNYTGAQEYEYVSFKSVW